jgi:hypothetical protein
MFADKSFDYAPPHFPIPGKQWGSLLFHRSVVRSLSFPRLPFLSQELGKETLEFDDGFVRWPFSGAVKARAVVER